MFDIGVKVQIILMELAANVFWLSVVDLFMFLLSFSLFLTYPSLMATIFLHVLHVARAVIGGLIIWKLPNNQDLITEASSVLQSPGQRI